MPSSLRALALGLVASISAHAAEPTGYEIADAHLHFVTFAQTTDGVAALIRAMDEAKVTDAVLWGMPVTKIWGPDEAKRPAHSLDAETRMYWDSRTDYIVAHAWRSATPAQQARLHPFVCGVNGNDRNAFDHVRQVLQANPGVFQGIGEIFAHHDYVSYMTDGVTPRPDAPGYRLVYDFAAAYRMPVVIHTNITSGRNRSPLYLERLLAVVRAYPKTRFVWAHVGISNDMQIPGLHKILRDELARHPNLSVDLSWLVWDRQVLPDLPDWVAVIREFPDRFTIGTDIVGEFADRDAYRKEIRKYDLLLDALPRDVAVKVARQNFLDLLPPPVVLRDADKVTY